MKFLKENLSMGASTHDFLPHPLLTYDCAVLCASCVSVRVQIEGAMKSLKEDPEMGEIFNELEAGGPAAMMKYWNNPEVLKKLGETMGGVFDFQVS